MKSKLIIILLLLSSYCWGQNQIIHVWPEKVPGEVDAKHQPEDYTANKSGINIHRVTNITDPTLTVYKPVKNANGAAIIICPGGGNKYLAINIEGEEIASHFAARGYTAFVLTYRVPYKTLGALQDLQRAISLIRNGASTWKLKPNLIGVIGFSAGGNLAARAATGFNNRSYESTDQIDTTSCRPDFSLLIYPGSLMASEQMQTPDIKPFTGTPPIFMFVTADDQNQIPFAFGQQLRILKLPFEFHVYPQGGHGYGLRKGNVAAETWPNLAENWISKFRQTKK